MLEYAYNASRCIIRDRVIQGSESPHPLIAPPMYFLYIIECADKSLYTGITNNLERRFREHKQGTGGHYTRSKKVERIVYTEEHPDRSSASKREAEVKGWTREKKLNLIQLRHKLTQ